MLILLPPSETKRPGGDGPALDIDGLVLPGLAPIRSRVSAALIALSSDVAAAARVLKLGPRQLDQVGVNRELFSAPTMPAVDRYTGVLFDALGAGVASSLAREWLGEHAAIHSAPWGPIGALDAIPAYRLSAATNLPGIGPPKRLWQRPVAHALAGAAPAYTLDLRSEAYVALGAAPAGADYVRVVAQTHGGAVRALNHFNKRAKGELVRRLADERPDIRSRADLLDWAEASELSMRPGETGLELVVDEAWAAGGTGRIAPRRQRQG